MLSQEGESIAGKWRNRCATLIKYTADLGEMDTIWFATRCGGEIFLTSGGFVGEYSELQGLTVMVVDDSMSIRLFLKSTLNGIGITNVIQAANGREALARLISLQRTDERKIDLVICDWNMPEVTGLDLLVEMRSRESMATIPFIMLTSVKEKDKILLALQTGISGYIVKPFIPQCLLDKMSEIFRKK